MANLTPAEKEVAEEFALDLIARSFGGRGRARVELGQEIASSLRGVALAVPELARPIERFMFGYDRLLIFGDDAARLVFDLHRRALTRRLSALGDNEATRAAIADIERCARALEPATALLPSGKPVVTLREWLRRNVGSSHDLEKAAREFEIALEKVDVNPVTGAASQQAVRDAGEHLKSAANRAAGISGPGQGIGRFAVGGPASKKVNAIVAAVTKRASKPDADAMLAALHASINALQLDDPVRRAFHRMTIHGLGDDWSAVAQQIAGLESKSSEEAAEGLVSAVKGKLAEAVARSDPAYVALRTRAEHTAKRWAELQNRRLAKKAGRELAPEETWRVIRSSEALAPGIAGAKQSGAFRQYVDDAVAVVGPPEQAGGQRRLFFSFTGQIKGGDAAVEQILAQTASDDARAAVGAVRLGGVDYEVLKQAPIKEVRVFAGTALPEGSARSKLFDRGISYVALTSSGEDFALVMTHWLRAVKKIP